MTKESILSKKNFILRIGEKFSKFFDTGTFYEIKKDKCSYVCNTTNYAKYARIIGKYNFVDFWISFNDKKDYLNLSPILEKELPFDNSYPNTVIKALEKSFNKMFKSQKYFEFDIFPESNWQDFMPQGKKRLFSSSFNNKNTLKYINIQGSKKNLVVSSTLGAFIGDNSCTEAGVLISIPTNAQYSSKLQLIVSAVSGKHEIYLTKRNELEKISLEELITVFEDAVDISNFNSLYRVLGRDMDVGKKDFRNLSDEEKEVLFDLSKMVTY